MDANCPGRDVAEDGGVHPSNPQSPRRLTAKQRRTQVMEYKLLGASVRQIAEAANRETALFRPAILPRPHDVFDLRRRVILPPTSDL